MFPFHFNHCDHISNSYTSESLPLLIRTSFLTTTSTHAFSHNTAAYGHCPTEPTLSWLETWWWGRSQNQYFPPPTPQTQTLGFLCNVVSERSNYFSISLTSVLCTLKDYVSSRTNPWELHFFVPTTKHCSILIHKCLNACLSTCTLLILNMNMD